MTWLRTPRSLAACVALLLASTPGWTGEEAPPEGATGPKLRAKITSPYVQSVLGSWDARVVIPGGPELKGAARYWLALDGTALAEEFVAGEGDMTFYGFGIRYVLADGKTLRQWWFDTEGSGGMWPSEGPLTAEGWEVQSDVRGKKSVHRMRKEGDGHVFTMELGGAPQVTVHYTKAAAECPTPPVSEVHRMKHPLIEAQLGSWDVKGTFRMGDETVSHAGTSTMRFVVGGKYLLQEYEIRGDAEHAFGHGLSTLGPDGASLRMWWFSNADEKPIDIEGPLTETEWKGTAQETSVGSMEFSFAKTETGLRMRARMPEKGLEGEETYTRKP